MNRMSPRRMLPVKRWHALFSFLCMLAAGAPAQGIADSLAVRPAALQTIMPVRGAPVDSSSPKPSPAQRIVSPSDTASASGMPKIALPPALPAVIDTADHFWSRPHWGIGAAWALGSFSLFSEWGKGLPASSADIIGASTELKNFIVKEPAVTYTIVLPVTLSITPFAGAQRSLSFEGSVFYFSKDFLAALQNDSATKTLNWKQSCAAYSFSLGLVYRKNVPAEYFKIDGVDNTSMVLGVGVSPFIRVSESASFSSSGGVSDSTTAAAAGNAVNRAFNGIGLTWKCGIATLHRLSPRGGLEVSLLYVGSWYGNFKNGSSAGLLKEINPKTGSAGAAVSSMSNTLQIQFSLISGKAKK